MPKIVKHTIIREMGFKNIADFIITAFGLYAGKLLLISATIMGGIMFMLSELDGWVNRLVYSPSVTLYTLLLVIVLDWLSAVVPAILKKEFETAKARRIVPVAVAHVLLLAVVFHAERTVVEPAGELARSAYHLFRLGLTNYIFFVYLLSAVSNAGRHGYLKLKVVSFIAAYVDRHKGGTT